MRRICVYCGSSSGSRPVYTAAASELARALTEAGLGLVYGGARVGLMGTLADAVLAAGGEVHGVIPECLSDVELMHTGLTELHQVVTMHERKALMNELADGFIALPGGFGTLEELFEIITWAQLRLHAKPIGLLNTDAYYDPLLQFLRQATAQGFIRPERLAGLHTEPDPFSLLKSLSASSSAPDASA